MVAKLKGKLLPRDYQHSLFRKIQNLRHRLLVVTKYNAEFYKVDIKEGYIEDTFEKFIRYINGLILDIQDEISLLSPRIMEDA